MAQRVTWSEKDDTHTAKTGGYALKVWQSKQFSSYGWSVVRGHIVRAGDAKTLELAQTEAEVAAEAVSRG